MTLLSQLAALAAIVGTGVVYGTDVFCALVQRPALARVDDATLTAVTGNVHRFADRRVGDSAAAARPAPLPVRGWALNRKYQGILGTWLSGVAPAGHPAVYAGGTPAAVGW